MPASRVLRAARALMLTAALMLPIFGLYSNPSDKPSPVLPSEERADSDALGKAGAAISRYRMGNQGEPWAELRRSADPAVRAHLIHRLAVDGIPVQVVMSRLRKTTDAGERAALILSLGEFTEQQIAVAKRKAITAFLLALYRNDPDPEVHSGVDWLFHNSNEGPARQRIDWGQRGALEAIDLEIAGNLAAKQEWSINSAGLTMVEVRIQATFQMGADAHEPRMRSDESVHRVGIPRVYAISTKDVTVAQFQRYLEDRGLKSMWREAVRQRFPLQPDSFWSDSERPQFAVSWYDAASYCNWLSWKSGIPPDQWVYPDEIGPGMRLPPDYLHRAGYRLPTEAEWEFSARAGISEAHFFGDGVALLNRYAWFMANSENHGWPVGMLKPNPLGLFDMYGNAWQWLQDRRVDYPADPEKITMDTEDAALVVTNEIARTRRGGSWSYDKETTRSAHRGALTYFPDQRRDSVGFRVARTISATSVSSDHGENNSIQRASFTSSPKHGNGNRVCRGCRHLLAIVAE
jgi:formylglycine-generating enzyme required for sulfatase activity